MRVLVLESEPGVSQSYEQQLAAAGHDVVRCHEAGAPSFPCTGIADHAGCPLEAAPVDVALLVRDAIDERPTHRESGVSCAMRARVPVIEPRPAEGAVDPFAGYVTPFDGDVVAAAVDAAAGASEGHADAVRAQLLTSPAAAGLAPDEVVVRAHRRGRLLHVEVLLPSGVPDELVVAAKGYAAAAARRYDPVVQVIDVVVHTA
jgi:hypothetical protein